jgi:hypothetical protein
MTAMNPQYSPEEIERIARKRAGAKMGWFIHLAVYLVVNLFWVAKAAYGDNARPWHVGPALGWGIGVLLHGISVFVLGKGSGLRERMVRKERERLMRQQNREP